MVLLMCCYADGYDPRELRLNTGSHVLSLYCAPVPDVTTMIADSPQLCGHASVKLRISLGIPRPSSVTTSEESDSDGDDAAETRVDEVSSAAFIVCCVLCYSDSRFVCVCVCGNCQKVM